MNEILKDKKIRNRLFTVAVITTPLLALLAGTPFARFELNKINLFFPGIFMIALITLLFWVVNILLVSLSVQFRFLEKLIIRSLFSTVICLLLSAVIFYYFQKIFPPPQIRFNDPSQKSGQLMPQFQTGNKNITSFPAMKDSLAVQLQKGLKPMPKSLFFFPRMIHILTINIIIIILCELILLYFKKQMIELENERLKQANLEARNDQLKMQLQPHFLFNSLNTLRLLLKKDKEKAEDYLLMLSDVLRFSTASVNEPLVDLAEELKFCLTYLEMQQVRFNGMLHFTIANELYSAEGKVPVFALQTLVENAIKHNAFTTEKPLEISINYNQLSGMITVKNKIQPKQLFEVTTRVGLKNLAERYKLLCNEDIIINTNNNEFAVTIKLIQTEK
ncbi:MAG: histidine kinase [Lacibacter sp.]